jgi:hypothetical protein
MLRTTIRNRMLVFVAVAASFTLFVQSASACDRDKLARLASGASQAAHIKTSTTDAAKQVAGSGMPKPAQGMIGLWQVTDFYQGQVFDQYFDTWNADGNEFFIDNTNPAADNVCQGIWKQVSVNAFKLKHVSWTFDSTGTVNGTAIFHDVVQVSADGNSFTGTENVLIYDLNGVLVAEYDGDVLQATRITVDF